jgi:hypothetical protein
MSDFVPLTLVCDRCNNAFTSSHITFHCPSCRPAAESVRFLTPAELRFARDTAARRWADENPGQLGPLPMSERYDPHELEIRWLHADETTRAEQSKAAAYFATGEPCDADEEGHPCELLAGHYGPHQWISTSGRITTTWIDWDSDLRA